MTVGWQSPDGRGRAGDQPLTTDTAHTRNDPDPIDRPTMTEAESASTHSTAGDGIEAGVELLVERDASSSMATSPFDVEGGARAAFSYPTFRRVYFGALLSNIGSWMQTVILGAFIYRQTGSATYVALGTLAQLGPLLLFSIPGGVIADRFDRRTVLMVVSGRATVVLARDSRLGHTTFSQYGRAAHVHPGHRCGTGCQRSRVLGAHPHAFVDRKDMAGAISLKGISANMNLSRVIGQAIGGVLYATVGASWVFVGNAVTYLFIIAALWGVEVPRVAIEAGESRLRRLLGGVRAARRDPVIARCLCIMVLSPFFCLPVAVLMPVLAHSSLGLDEDRSPTASCTHRSDLGLSSVHCRSARSSTEGTWPGSSVPGWQATHSPSPPSRSSGNPDLPIRQPSSSASVTSGP